jgi:hypothetical protein
MRTVVSFGDLKQAGLYFDRALPVAFRRAQGTGDDIVFDFPEHIPSRALVSLVFDEHDLSEPVRFSRLGQVLHRWGDFSRAIAPYRTERTVRSYEDKYEDLRIAYLENRSAPDSTPVRAHFTSFAATLGLECADALLPSSGRAVSSEYEPALVLSRLELIDTSQTSWEQIVELRKDQSSRARLQRLRAFLTQNYSGKSAAFVEDDIGRRLHEYEETVRKFGFETTTSAISVLLDSKSLHGAVATGIGAALFGGPLLGITAAAAVELGRVSLEVAKQRRRMHDWQATHELAYVIEARKRAL